MIQGSLSCQGFYSRIFHWLLGKHLLLLLAKYLSDVSLLWLLFAIGLFIRWMWRMLSSMKTFKKKCTCNHPLAILTQAVKFVAFTVLFMASSRLLGLDLKSLAQLWLSKVSLWVLKTLLFVQRFSAGITLILFYVDDMIITRDNSRGICSLQHFLDNILRWKIWTFWAIFLVLRLPHPWWILSFPS